MTTGPDALVLTSLTAGIAHTLLGPDHYLPFIVLSKGARLVIAQDVRDHARLRPGTHFKRRHVRIPHDSDGILPRETESYRVPCAAIWPAGRYCLRPVLSYLGPAPGIPEKRRHYFLRADRAFTLGHFYYFYPGPLRTLDPDHDVSGAATKHSRTFWGNRIVRRRHDLNHVRGRDGIVLRHERARVPATGAFCARPGGA